MMTARASVTVLLAALAGGTTAFANDSCFNAFRINVGSVNGSTTNATNDGQAGCGFSTGPDVWYEFVPQCNGVYRFATCVGITNYDTVVSVHTECPGVAGNAIACNDDTSLCGAFDTASQVDVALTAGTPYLVRVGGFSTNPAGNFTLTVSEMMLDGPPANDTCAGAEVLGLGETVGSTFCATTEFPSVCGFQSTSDVWYSFTPECGGTYTFDTCAAASFDTVVSLHAGCGDAFICNDDFCSEASSSVSAVLEAGVDYRIRVAGLGFAARGTFTLTATRGADTVAANDECSNAIDVGVGTVNGSTFCASRDGFASCGASNGSNDVWYRFVPDCSAFYSVDTIGSTNYDTVLSIHSECPGNIDNQLACNDDFVDLSSRLLFNGTAGTPVYIRVSGFNDMRGDFQLNISDIPNDTCENAIFVNDGSFSFSNRGAATDGLPDGLCADVAGDEQVNSDVWFLYFASCDGETRVDTCSPARFDTKLAVYLTTTGQCPPSAPVACNDDSECGRSSIVTFPTMAGEAYYIRVGGYSDRQGCGVLNIVCTPASTCSTCAADYNQDGGVDGSDVDVFFADWVGSAPCADVNLDGGIDGSDVDVFFSFWSAGGC
jgi:hypothetical protein